MKGWTGWERKDGLSGEEDSLKVTFSFGQLRPKSLMRFCFKNSFVFINKVSSFCKRNGRNCSSDFRVSTQAATSWKHLLTPTHSADSSKSLCRLSKLVLMHKKFILRYKTSCSILKKPYGCVTVREACLLGMFEIPKKLKFSSRMIIFQCWSKHFC